MDIDRVRRPEDYFTETRQLRENCYPGDYVGRSDHPKRRYSIAQARDEGMYVAKGHHEIGPLSEEIHEELEFYPFDWSIFAFVKAGSLWIFEVDYYRPSSRTKNGEVEDTGVVSGCVHSYGEIGAFNWTSGFKVDFKNVTVYDTMILASKERRAVKR